MSHEWLGAARYLLSTYLTSSPSGVLRNKPYRVLLRHILRTPQRRFIQSSVPTRPLAATPPLPYSAILRRRPHHPLLPYPLRSPQRRFLQSATTPVRPLTNPPPLSFCIAASYSAKNHPFDPHRDLFKYDPSVRSKLSTLRPRPGIRPQSGQDSFFVSDVGETGTVAFGVVDGVGGWESSGVDPAHFAHGLCDHMAMGAARYPAEFRAGPLRPRELLQYGYDQVMSTDEIVAGGSTACVASIEPNGRLNVANLGDSGFIHLGPNHVRHFSKPQTHAFNTPYQLSKIPPFMQLQMRLFGPAEAHAETPADAHLSHHQLHPGDVLIFATDGVWDNLSPEDTLKLVGRTMQANGAWVVGEEGVTIGNLRGGQGTKDGGGECQLCSALAVAVTREAKEASLNGMREGPFAREVRRHFPGEQWMGGKPDDICTVVAVVREMGG